MTNETTTAEPGHSGEHRTTKDQAVARSSGEPMKTPSGEDGTTEETSPALHCESCTTKDLKKLMLRKILVV